MWKVVSYIHNFSKSRFLMNNDLLNIETLAQILVQLDLPPKIHFQKQRMTLRRDETLRVIQWCSCWCYGDWQVILTGEADVPRTWPSCAGQLRQSLQVFLWNTLTTPRFILKMNKQKAQFILFIYPDIRNILEGLYRLYCKPGLFTFTE